VEDAKTQFAVLHQLLIIGEAVKRLSQEFRAAHPDVRDRDRLPLPLLSLAARNRSHGDALLLHQRFQQGDGLRKRIRAPAIASGAAGGI
jgi:hypothetical protein